MLVVYRRLLRHVLPALHLWNLVRLHQSLALWQKMRLRMRAVRKMIVMLSRGRNNWLLSSNRLVDVLLHVIYVESALICVCLCRWLFACVSLLHFGKTNSLCINSLCLILLSNFVCFTCWIFFSDWSKARIWTVCNVVLEYVNTDALP